MIVKLASEFESDFCGLSQKWFCEFNTGKTEHVSFEWSNNSGYWCENKWVCSRRKIIFEGCQDLSCLLNWLGPLTWSLLLKLPPRKLKFWFVLDEITLLLSLLFIFIYLPYYLAFLGWCSQLFCGYVGWATEMGTWNCWSLHLLLFLSHGSLLKCSQLKGYLCYKTILYHKVALDVQLMNFFIWRKNNVLFSRYQDFRVLVKFANFKICDVIVSIAG